MTEFVGVPMMREPIDMKKGGFVVLLSVLILVSTFPFVSQDSKAQPGQWTDAFGDETKVFSKVNTEVVGGSARIQQLASNYSWQKKGVVLDIGQGGDPDAKYASYPWVIKGSDGTYRMWYSAVSGSDVYQIAYATSHDGYNWTKHGAVISPGFSGTGSDSRRVHSPAVIDEGDYYRMYYTGVDISDVRITLMAISQDGKSWTYDGLAINYGGSGETKVSAYASVLKDGGSYKSWYSGFSLGGSYQIFHATSPDGVTWTKQGIVMPLGAPGEPDDDEILKNVVIRNSTGTYRMWYGAVGTKWRILYAESPDGKDWTDRHGIVLYEGAPGEPDEQKVAIGSVHLPVNNAGWIWYVGFDNVPHARIMIATMGSLGNLTSTVITKSPGYDWEKLFLNKTALPDETEVLISVLDATTLVPFPGFSDLSGTVIDLSSLSKTNENIRLKADFYGTMTATPLLHDWTVTWDDIGGPIFGGLNSASDDGTGGNVTLDWNPATDPSTPITYNVYMSLTPGGQDFGSPNYTTSATSLQVTGLTNGLTYHFVVRAVDGLGNEETNSVERSVIPTTPIDSTPPTFAGLQSAVDSGTGGNVTLSWFAATDPDTVESNSDPSLPIFYNIYYSLTPGGQTIPWAGTTGTGFEVTGLMDGNDYYFVVRAEDSVGNEDNNSVELSAMPTTPIDSTPPTFTGLGSVMDLGTGGALRLNWSDANDPDTTKCNTDPSLPITYNIYYSRISGGQDFMNPNATTTNTQIDISDLENGALYYFVVRAEDSAGNEESNLIEKSLMPTTPVDDTPPNFGGIQFAVDAGTGGTVTLSWLTATDPDTPECNSDPSLPVSYDIFYSRVSGLQDFQSPNATTQSLSSNITGLTDGVPYYFVVRARDSVGNEETNTVERMAVPTTPTDTTPPNFAGLESAFDSQTSGNVTLMWSPATDPDTVECNSDPSLPITYYVYISTVPGNQNFLLPNVTTQDTQIEITNLKNGLPYYFVVRARDSAGNQESNLMERSTIPTTPVDSTPPLFSGVVVAMDDETGGAVKLYWADATDPDLIECNSDPSLPITYNVYFSTTSGGQNFLVPSASTQDSTVTISGLQNGTTYHFVVRARDAVGNEESNAVEMSAMPTTPVDSTPPQFLGIQFATDVGSSGNITLTWQVGIDPDTVECNSDPSLPLQYNIYVSVNSSGQDFNVPNKTTSNTQVTLDGLQNGITYYFVVRAEDAAGNEDDNLVERSATPTTPVDSTPPTFGGLDLVTTDEGTGEITLSWSAATDPDEPECNSDPSQPIKYNIYVSESPDDFDFSQPTRTTHSPQFVFLELRRGVTYYFIVRAEDGAGNEEANSVTESAFLEIEEEPFNLLDYLWIIFLVVIIILLALIAVLLAKQRKKEGRVEEDKARTTEEEPSEDASEEESAEG